MGIAPVEQFQHERRVVNTSGEGTDIESGTLSGNPPCLFNGTHGEIFKKESQALVSTFDRFPIHSYDIAEAEPLWVVWHSDDSEFRFQLDALARTNPLVVAFHCDSGRQDFSVVAQILVQSFEDHRKRDILRAKRPCRENQQ
jgi:hypothetical protein